MLQMRILCWAMTSLQRNLNSKRKRYENDY